MPKTRSGKTVGFEDSQGNRLDECVAEAPPEGHVQSSIVFGKTKMVSYQRTRKRKKNIEAEVGSEAAGLVEDVGVSVGTTTEGVQSVGDLLATATIATTAVPTTVTVETVSALPTTEGVQSFGDLPATATTATTSVPTTVTVETVSAGPSTESVQNVGDLSAAATTATTATTSVPTIGQPSGIAGATTGQPSGIAGATTGQPSGTAGATTGQSSGTECFEYDTDDGVEVDTNILLGKDWNVHVGYALLNLRQDRGVIECKQSSIALKYWKIETESVDFQARLNGNMLYKLLRASYNQANRVFVNAFVERWHSETNTFHLPFGEMTITLDDVHVITGLPVAGKAINFEFAKDANPVKFVHEMLGIDVKKVADEFTRVGGLRVSKSWLLKNIAAVKRKEGEGSSTGESQAIHVVGEGSSTGGTRTTDQAVRGYLLYMLACTLFLNRSGDKISVAYLHFLKDLDSVGEWSWGAAALANLYRQLSKASMANTSGISGYLTLLEAWVYEHFPSMRPPVNKDFNAMEMVRILKWRPVAGMNDQVALSLLKRLREDMDLMEARDVVWDAYKDVRTVLDNDVCWFYGCIRTLDIVEVYHPNRVVRQFGHVRCIPQDPIPPKFSKKTGKVKEYNVEYESRDDDFLHYANHLVNKEQRLGKVRFDSECTEDYMGWYRSVAVRRLTGVKKMKQRDSRQESSKSILVEALDEAISNISKKSKKDLLKVLKMSRNFATTGVCTVQEGEEDEEEVPQPKKRAKTTRKR